MMTRWDRSVQTLWAKMVQTMSSMLEDMTKKLEEIQSEMI
jgi:hypothetical protein